MKKIMLFFSVLIFFSACSGPTFKERIIDDISSKMNTGICEDIPKGALINEVVVGDITPIGDSGLIDVSFSIQFDTGQEIKKQEGALLYSKRGNRYKLEKIGGCKYGI